MTMLLSSLLETNYHQLDQEELEAVNVLLQVAEQQQVRAQYWKQLKHRGLTFE